MSPSRLAASPAPRTALTCTRCGTTVEVQLEVAVTAEAGALGFDVASHRLELFGRCGDCRALGVPPGAAWGEA